MVRCERCGHENELPQEMKRWIIRIYEAATGKIVLPEADGWAHKRRELTPYGGVETYCGQTDGWGELHWSKVNCPTCLARRRKEAHHEAR